MTTAEAARILGVTPGRVRQLVMAGRLHPALRLARALLLRRDEVEALAASRLPRGRPRAPRPAREGDSDAP